MKLVVFFPAFITLSIHLLVKAQAPCTRCWWFDNCRLKCVAGTHTQFPMPLGRLRHFAILLWHFLLRRLLIKMIQAKKVILLSHFSARWLHNVRSMVLWFLRQSSGYNFTDIQFCLVLCPKGNWSILVGIFGNSDHCDSEIVGYLEIRDRCWVLRMRWWWDVVASQGIFAVQGIIFLMRKRRYFT